MTPLNPELLSAPASTTSDFGTMRDFDRDSWSRLMSGENPFLQHEFLATLEGSGCVHERAGWLPLHHGIKDKAGSLLAASPLYIKSHSFGEFVFDWLWADVYERSGHAYYPKLVSAIPFTPVTGRRLCGSRQLRGDLVEGAKSLVRSLGISGVHWLFCTAGEKRFFSEQSCITRLDYQYHWHNRGYRCFDDFLAVLTSKKRKMIRRERRLVREQGLRVTAVPGQDLGESRTRRIFALYENTYLCKSGFRALNLGFFQQIVVAMPDRFVAFLAEREDEIVACALCFRDDNALYGRYWGCQDFHELLHFETCFYAGIEYCISNGLKRFEPGAQGLHKIPRGFLPTETWSAHWFARPQFGQLIAEFCRREEAQKRAMLPVLLAKSPYRVDGASVSQHGE